MQFGMVEAESLDFDDHMTFQWLGFRQRRIDEAVQAAELFEHDYTHDYSPNV